MYKSLNLLYWPVEEVVDVTGEPIKGNGFSGHTTGLTTCCIMVQNFRGRLSVQASIVNTPTEDSDWFSVLPGGVPYFQYPLTNYIVRSPLSGQTSTSGFNFYGNVIWVRAVITRSYMIPVDAKPLYVSMFGRVDSILINY